MADVVEDAILEIAPAEPAEPIEPAVASTYPPREAIELRAYEYFLDRGASHGSDVDDWLRAERELAEAVAEADQLTMELNQKPGN